MRPQTSKVIVGLALVLGIGMLLVGCGTTPTPVATPVPATAAPIAPTKAPAAPANTPVPPAPTKAAAPAKDTIIIAIPAEPSTVDVMQEDGNMRMVSDNVSEGLLLMDGKTLQVVPGLATEWKSTSPTTWNLKLRQGVTFQNGDPFTADDAIFSIKRMIDPATKSGIIGYFTSITDVVKVSDFEINVVLKGADPIFPVRMTLLKILDKKFISADPTKVTTQLIGTGPYKVTSWTRGQSIVLDRNDNYWGKKPAIKTVRYRFIEEDATRAAALKNGEVDLALNMLPEYVKDLPQVLTANGQEFTMMRLNALRGVMQSTKMRLAVNYAVDKEAIAKALFQGYAKVAAGQLFKPGYTGYNPNLKAYPFDPAKAKQLLSEAGYKGETVQIVGERGRWLKDGEQVETVAQMLRDVGMKVEVQMLSFQAWLQILPARDKAPDLFFTSHANIIHDADRTLTNYVHSKGSSGSYPGLFDTKIEQARSELDVAARQKDYDSITTALYDDPPWMPLVNPLDIYGAAKNLVWTAREDASLAVYEMSFSQ